MPHQNRGTLSGAGHTRSSDKAPLIGGRYKRIRSLGEGGMGAVSLAKDTHMDDRLVALKFVRGDRGSILAEARAACKLRHPNIAAVLDVVADVNETEMPCLVEDYIDGTTLEAYLKGRASPMSEEETIRILKPVAAALDYVHGMGVIHRDIKPSNIILDKNGKPYVIDFGVARRCSDGRTSSGTPEYMSPEQACGESPTPDMDVYSLAATAFECVTKDLPSRARDKALSNDELGLGPFGIRLRAWICGKPQDRPAKCEGLFPHSGGTHYDDFGIASYPDELSDEDFHLMESFDGVVREAAEANGVDPRSIWTPGAVNEEVLSGKLLALVAARTNTRRAARAVRLFSGWRGQRFAERILAKAGRQVQLSRIEKALYEIVALEVQR